MQDQKKTKTDLIDELHNLRSQVAELEKRVLELEQTSLAPPELVPERSQRKELATNIHVIGDFNLIQGRSINVSDSGICFEVNYDIPFEMEFEVEGRLEQQRAHLIWMKQLDDGRNQFGFHFVPGGDSLLFELFR